MDDKINRVMTIRQGKRNRLFKIVFRDGDKPQEIPPPESDVISTTYKINGITTIAFIKPALLAALLDFAQTVYEVEGENLSDESWNALNLVVNAYVGSTGKLPKWWG